MTPFEQAFLRHLGEHWVSEARWQRMLDVLAQRTRFVTVVMDNLYQVHNASAVMRTCEAMGVQDLHLVQRAQGLSLERGIAMGAEHWMTSQRYHNEAGTRACIEHLRAQGYRLVATSPHAEKSLDDLTLDQPTALLFGEEKPGLSEAMMAASDVQVRLPMVGFTESYNVSVSVALCLDPLLRRLRRSTLDWSLTQAERDELLLAWSRRSVQHVDDVEARFAQTYAD